MWYRFRDILMASFGLMILSPVFLAIVILLKLTQDRVFFFQTRPGLNGIPFRLIKFSTMRDALPGDPEEAHQIARLTRWGKRIRQASLDELPQLINVLKGDMSIVGPRPLLMEYLSLYSEKELRRHLVPPGITGWAQIHGRNRISFKERFAYDIWYVDHRSFWLDLKIIFKTFGRVFTKADVFADQDTISPKFDGTN
ncbi:sugar transferase [Pontibacter sp. G13]|uniref:sugar transferase n=1 Tax=Pontibacter sp. G13 TaxID=3074898 RepID=UPI0028890E9E|nr:sugar transferase [Pontibacter sp. G13]WNJ16034.1 sugar transferase [Pontibacter sp. G13]